jgi:hypothetical protein
LAFFSGFQMEDASAAAAAGLSASATPSASVAPVA